MKNLTKFLLISYIFTLASCSGYLDVVPDNTLKLENIFSVKEEAWNGLTKIYSYLPPIHDANNTTWTLGDEYLGRYDYIVDATNFGYVRSMHIMRGLQSVTSPILGDWSGNGGGRKLYEGIRQTNVFIENIDKVADMTNIEKADWKAQAIFLKAYYNFLLIQKYGPIVIVDKAIKPDAMSSDLFMARSKLEDCFDYVLRLMDEAIPRLKEKAIAADLGQIDQLGAKAIKTKVLLFRASPFYNGNSDYFGDFYDKDGKTFFPMEYNREKWKDVIDAANETIKLCEENGKGLFTFEKDIYLYDREDYAANEDLMKTLYDLRMLIVSPWNKELLWGFTNFNFSSDGGIAQACNIRLPAAYAVASGGAVEETAYSWQWMCATYQMLERYYTRNGLPVDEDLTFDRNKMYNLVTLPPRDDPEYQRYAGYLQPGAETVNLYLNREPRFYANLGITGGYWRGHLTRINTMFYQDTEGGLGVKSSTDFLVTGIGIQKFVHPESTSGNWTRQQRYPYPIIRLADVYLMKAEAMNEYYGPSSEIYELLDKIRKRAGIPGIDVSWGEHGRARNPNKHKDQAGLRDIILQERSIELAFEGSRFWDMLRHKRASREFSAPVWGWNAKGYTAQEFFVLDVKHSRKFSITDCLWPIDLNEMNTNSNLIQNPGWK